MKIDKDSVPVTHEGAVDAVLDSLSRKDVAEIRCPDFTPAQVHHSVGRFLRNAWSLWEPGTVLRLHYRDRFGIGHPDDISGMILQHVTASVREQGFDPVRCAAGYREFWVRQGLDPVKCGG